jgi:hypothetical protein
MLSLTNKGYYGLPIALLLKGVLTNEKDFDQQNKQKKKNISRLYGPYGLQKRPPCLKPPPRQGQKAFSSINFRHLMPRDGHTVGMHERTILPEIGKN